MKIRFLAAMMFVFLLLAGCGSDTVVVVVSPPPVKTTITSSLLLDGYVVEDPFTLGLTSFQNTASLFAGIDPATGAEYRAFIGFSLTGAGGVPGNAVIDFATLDIVIRSIQTAGSSIPIRIELVSFAAPLQPNNFDRIILPPLAFTTIVPPITAADVGKSVPVDVTGLMKEVQIRKLANFQVRILEDFGFVTSGRIEIDDTAAGAPQLTVSYF